jgi:hypothetical protein
MERTREPGTGRTGGRARSGLATYERQITPSGLHRRSGGSGRGAGLLLPLFSDTPSSVFCALVSWRVGAHRGQSAWMSENDVRRIPADEVDGDEGWERITDEPEVHCVEAIKTADADAWFWSVTISAMEFVREDPLSRTCARAFPWALRSVPGVPDVAEQDREVWVVSGSPSGEGLVRACASAVDTFADRIRSHVSGL